ncbi:MAG: 30S ribosomal protein S12 methylthiotransferase RimO [Clostridia bacterium]
MKVGIISLGCDKNRCDTEIMLQYLVDGGYEITNEQEDADVLIVNTCAFLESSRVESIDTIMELSQLKETGKLKKLIISGCLPKKYIQDIYNELYEVDGFLGTTDYPYICEVVKKCFENKRVNAVNSCKKSPINKKYLTTPSHYAYLMIADGCDNHCTYCTIPQIRGKFTSKPMELILEQAKDLTKEGVKELILVAQDVTSYGLDTYHELALVSLLKELSKIDELNQIRLLYCYPEKVTDELIEEIATNDKIVKYIDIPIQHASTAVLKRMGRFGTYESYLELFQKLKNRIENIAIRSTVMIGFPGETDEDFETLLKFLNEVKPINCGYFAYSDEEDAASRKLPDKVSEKVANSRIARLTDVLSKIAYEEKSKFIGKTLKIVYEDIDFDNNRFIGRSYISAPDIDTLVFFSSDKLVEVGETYDIKITAIENDDLIGELQ